LICSIILCSSVISPPFLNRCPENRNPSVGSEVLDRLAGAKVREVVRQTVPRPVPAMVVPNPNEGLLTGSCAIHLTPGVNPPATGVEKCNSGKVLAGNLTTVHAKVGAGAVFDLVTVVDGVGLVSRFSRDRVGVGVGLDDELAPSQVEIPPTLSALSDQFTDVLFGLLLYNCCSFTGHNTTSLSVVGSRAVDFGEYRPARFTRTEYR
jgi:hypothetical protein